MTSYEHQWAMWPTQRDQRAELNDDLRTPREVEHFAYFAHPGRAESAAHELAAAGYTVELGRRGSETILRAARIQPLSDELVAQFLGEMVTIVERNGGDYDGWGAAVEVSTTA